MKRNAIIAVVVILALMLVGCGKNGEISAVREAAVGALDTVKRGDLAEMTTVWGYAYNQDPAELTNESLEALLQAYTQELDYSIGDVTVDGEHAQVAVSVTNRDMDKVVYDAALEWLDRTFAIENLQNLDNLDESMVLEQLVEFIKDGAISENDVTSRALTISFTKIDGQWKVSGGEEVLMAVLGNPQYLGEVLASDDFSQRIQEKAEELVQNIIGPFGNMEELPEVDTASDDFYEVVVDVGGVQ